MELQRYAVDARIFVEATDPDEASAILERHLAGTFDSEFHGAPQFARTASPATTPSCPNCGSERIEHHEDVVARRRFLRLGDEGAWLFDAISDSFDDDGERPRLWCGDCSQEWPLPEAGVEFV